MIEKSLNICTWNVCLGARCKLSSIKEVLIKHEIDILCLQEVDIRLDEDLGPYQIENYTMETENVTQPFKRRTLMYLSNNITYKRETTMEEKDNHIIIIRLVKQGVLITSMYRTYQITRHANHTIAFTEQLRILDQAINLEKRVVILGDFNLDQERRSDPSYHHSRLYGLWKEFEAQHQLSQMVKFVTWSRMDRGSLKTSLLDHIYTNDEGLIDSVTELSSLTSDHCPVLAVLALKTFSKIRRIWTRNWKNYNKENLLSQLALQNWDIRCTEAEDFYDEMEQKIMVAFDKLAPFEEKVLRTSHHESAIITEMKKKRKNMFQNAKRRKSAHLFVRCRKLKDKIKRIEASVRKTRIRNAILKGGQQGLWQGYKIAEDKPRDTFPATLVHGNYAYQSDPEKAQAFADFFREKVTNITTQARKDPSVSNGPIQPQVADKNFFNIENVTEAMSLLKDKSCFGFDNIPVKVLKDGTAILAPVFCKLFNIIYEQNSVPQKWRTSRVLPLYKKGDRRQIANYRPISNLCASSKIFERIILKRLLEVETELGTDLSGTTQHGFKKRRSTVTAAMELQNIIAGGLDEDCYVAVASMDLTAAFDVLDVSLLLTRMQNLGIPGDVLKLVGAWLGGRIGYVEVGTSCSEYFDIEFGSGQGSILGPVLFNFYIAPFVKEKNALSYADDNYQIAINKSKEEALKALQEKVIEAEHWMSGSGLKVNVEKTEMVVFHRYETGRSEIRVANTVIKSKPTMKVLGIQFDSRLSWDNQVDSAILNSRKSLHALRSVRTFFTDNEMIKLVTSNVYSKMYYGSQVWLLPNLKEKLFTKMYSHSGSILKIIDRESSFCVLHKKYNRSTPKIFALYQTSLNLYLAYQNFPNNYPRELDRVLLNERRNERFTFVRINRFKVGLNLLKNRLRSITNVVDKNWMDLNVESFKLNCKVRIIQNSLITL